MRLLIMMISIATLAIFPTTSFGKDTSQIIIETVFEEAEKAIIEEYFGTTADEKEKRKSKTKKRNKMPPGLAKKDSLPPGLAKQLEKNGTLPPGLAKKDLPDDLENLLPPTKDGTKRVIIDNDVVLIEKGTEIVLDILKDVIQ